MKSRKLSCVGFLMLSIGQASADTTIVNASLQYTIYLPDNWVLEEISDSQHIFYDTTFAFESRVSLVRYHRNATDYPMPDDWTRTHFIAYKLVVETTADPWGVVLYYDSSSASKQGSLWAPEMYSRFFSLDTTIGAWAEFTRFTASENYGYELYALGDTADMMTNLPAYGAIIYGIELPGSDVAVRYIPCYSRTLNVLTAYAKKPGIYDARGREMSSLPFADVPIASNFFINGLKRTNIAVR